MSEADSKLEVESLRRYAACRHKLRDPVEQILPDINFPRGSEIVAEYVQLNKNIRDDFGEVQYVLNDSENRTLCEELSLSDEAIFLALRQVFDSAVAYVDYFTNKAKKSLVDHFNVSNIHADPYSYRFYLRFMQKHMYPVILNSLAQVKWRPPKGSPLHLLDRAMKELVEKELIDSHVKSSRKYFEMIATKYLQCVLSDPPCMLLGKPGELLDSTLSNDRREKLAESAWKPGRGVKSGAYAFLLPALVYCGASIDGEEPRPLNPMQPEGKGVVAYAPNVPVVEQLPYAVAMPVFEAPESERPSPRSAPPRPPLRSQETQTDRPEGRNARVQTDTPEVVARRVQTVGPEMRTTDAQTDPEPKKTSREQRTTAAPSQLESGASKLFITACDDVRGAQSRAGAQDQVMPGRSTYNADNTAMYPPPPPQPQEQDMTGRSDNPYLLRQPQSAQQRLIDDGKKLLPASHNVTEGVDRRPVPAAGQHNQQSPSQTQQPAKKHPTVNAGHPSQTSAPQQQQKSSATHSTLGTNSTAQTTNATASVPGKHSQREPVRTPSTSRARLLEGLSNGNTQQRAPSINRTKGRSLTTPTSSTKTRDQAPQNIARPVASSGTSTPTPTLKSTDVSSLNVTGKLMTPSPHQRSPMPGDSKSPKQLVEDRNRQIVRAMNAQQAQREEDARVRYHNDLEKKKREAETRSLSAKKRASSVNRRSLSSSQPSATVNQRSATVNR